MARILVIDDEQAVRDSLAKILQREGHEVVTASDGEEGVRRWREQGAAVVILDIHMPKSDGIETLVQLRALALLLPVIVISGGDQTAGQPLGLLGDAKLLGAVGALAKPFSLSELTAAVNHALPSGMGKPRADLHRPLFLFLLLREYPRTPAPPEDPPAPPARLSRPPAVRPDRNRASPRPPP